MKGTCPWVEFLSKTVGLGALFAALFFKKTSFKETAFQKNSQKMIFMRSYITEPYSGPDYQNKPIGTNKCLIRNNTSKAPNI